MKTIEPTLFDNVESYNPFNGIRIFLSGTFSRSNQEIDFKLTNAGAITKMGLSKATCVIIAGKNQSEKDLIKIDTLKHDGFFIPTISESEMDLILCRKMYREFKEPIKNVDITYDFIFNSLVPKIQHFNFYEYTHPLGQKELFIYAVTGSKGLLLQSLGNIGAYSSNEFDPKSIDYCWLKKETIDNLKVGIKDEFINIITNTYNNSDSDKFTYKFIIEAEAIHWMEYRATSIGDEISLDLISKYKESVKTRS